jgi:RNA polymerase sigma-70 factor (ECF subfamily)
VKWKFNEYEKSPELSSDIEWMLQSGQVSREYFLETLLEAYYALVLRLATSLIDDSNAARDATRRTFLKAVLDVHQYRSQVGVETWLYKIAYQTCIRVQQRERIWKGIEKIFSLSGELTNPVSNDPPSEHDRLLWQAVDRLGDTERNILILQYANGWSVEQIAAVTGINTAQVIDLSNQALLELTKECSPADESLETALSRSLGLRWPLTHTSIEDIHEYARTIDGKAGGRQSVRRRIATLKEMAIIGLAILLVFLMIWGGNRFFIRSEEGSSLPGSVNSNAQRQSREGRTTPEKRLAAVGTPTPGQSGRGDLLSPRPSSTPTPTGVFYTVQEGDTLVEISTRFGTSPDELVSFNRIPDGAVLAPGMALVIPGSLPEGRQFRATPVTPVTQRISMKQPWTSEEVFQLRNPDVFPFHTVWLDAESISYPAGNESHPATRSHFQVWLSQRQFLIIGGPEGAEPEEVGIGLGGRFYLSNPGDGELFFKDVTSSYDRPPMSVPLFFGLIMLFGDSDEMAYSTFTVLGESVIAGREVWVVNQDASDGSREALLWLDKGTGLSLHVRRLDAPDFLRNPDENRPGEVLVKAVEYDVDFPQELFNYALPWRGGYARDYTGEPASIGENSYFTSDDKLASRMIKEAPPEGFDPSLSRLSFHYPVDSDPVSPMAGTDVYADGYYLSRIRMGIPWDTTCQRSKDGSKIIFSSGLVDPGGSTRQSGGTYYVDLRSLDEIYRLQPAESGTEGDFAISPDSRTVALWGCSGKKDSCGVYLHDMETHKWRKLVDNEEGAGDFVWSPDGKSLGWMTSGNVVIVMDVEKGEISYTDNYEALNQGPHADPPMKDWGVVFPPQTVGLDGCIFPPAE